ncbi:MAG: glycosyltransferase family 39 protein, partial [Candidatus Woesearchaeota archaeon]|nr:glycosyltransferase family 39 protein [Candidatus Woesearchaeota archaeon]
MSLSDTIEKRANFIVVLLLLVLFTLAITSIRDKSITTDEISHLASGYSYIKTWDFRLNIEALPLIDMISTVPLLFLDPILPLNSTNWALAEAYESEGQYHWEFGEQFFYEYGNDADKILFFGRIPMILLALLLGFYVFKFAKELFGVKSGLFALFLYVFSPNILAHSRLATIDLGASCFIFIAVYYFWKFINDISVKSFVIAGVTFGLAQLSKFTALYLIPIYVLLILVVVVLKKKEDSSFFNVLKSKKAFILYGMVVGIFIIGYLVVAGGYGFLHVGKYVEGLTYVVSHSNDGHPGYLMGMYSSQGWWYYFIVAFLIKTPIVTIVLMI